MTSVFTGVFFFSISLEDSIVCQNFLEYTQEHCDYRLPPVAEHKSTCGSWNSGFCAVSFLCCSNLDRPISEIQHPECGMLLCLNDFLWFEQQQLYVYILFIYLFILGGWDFICALSISTAEKYFEVSAGLVATYFPRTVN